MTMATTAALLEGARRRRVGLPACKVIISLRLGRDGIADVVARRTTVIGGPS